MFRSACNFYQLENVATYSGGTEGTALYPVVAESCANMGSLRSKLKSTGSVLGDFSPHTRG